MSTSENKNEAAPEDADLPPMTEAESESAEEVEAADAESADEEEDLSIEVEGEVAEGGEGEEDPTAQLQAELDAVRKEKDENYNRFVRATADLENYRKRARRDVGDARLDERGKILKDMLPVIDNLERALEHAGGGANSGADSGADSGEKSAEINSIIEGVNLVLRQFQQALEKNKVTPLDSVGKPFDPAIHEAVSQAPSADHPPGTVISALQRGYMMETRLLRPALVVVSTAMPAGESAAESDEADAEQIAELEARDTVVEKNAAAGEDSGEGASGEGSDSTDAPKEVEE